MPAILPSGRVTPPATSESVTYGEGKPVEEAATPSESAAEKQSVQKIEMVDPQVEELPDGSSKPAAESTPEGELELTPSASDEGPTA